MAFHQGAGARKHTAEVKLKTAKQRLGLLLLPGILAVYQETDIMMGVPFLLNYREIAAADGTVPGNGTNTGS